MTRILRRLALVLWLAARDSAWAGQSGLLLLGVGLPAVAVSSYTGPIDIVASPTALYSLRAGSAAIAAAGTQNIVDLRRASDNATCTATIAASGGALDLTVGTPCGGSTVTAWIGASSALVSKWYDQSGNGNHASQATAANQPQLSLSAGPASLPAVLFAGSHYLQGGATSWTSNPPGNTYSAIASRTGAFTTQQDIIANSLGSGPELWFGTSANTVGNQGTSTASATDNAFHAIQGVINSSVGALYVDGASTASTGSQVNNLARPLVLGANSSGTGRQLTGSIFEAGLWILASSAGQQAAMNTNQHAIGGGW